MRQYLGANVAPLKVNLVLSRANVITKQDNSILKGIKANFLDDYEVKHTL